MVWFQRHTPSIGDELWRRLLSDYPFLALRPLRQRERLRELTNRFLATKQFAGADGLMIDDYMGAAIAAQACLPVLSIGLDWYDDFEQIVVYPEQFRVRYQEADDIGLVHEQDTYLAGQSIDGGPIVLSWPDVQAADAMGEYNVVIHEFIHKIDLRDGVADGIPPLPRAARAQWIKALDSAFNQFADACDAAESRLPADLDPESDEALPYFANLPLDPYAATNPAEFFAVCGETVFTDPKRIEDSYPVFYQSLIEFFKLNTLDI